MRVRSILIALLLVVSGTFAMSGTAWAQEETGSDHTEISKESAECIELLEEGKEVDDCHESPSVILPATNEIIWGAISFFLLLALMWKLALPPVKKMMEARSDRIRENLDEAERTKSDAQQVLSDYQLQLADAKNESARIIDEARQTAEQMRRDLMVRAEAEVNELRDRTRAEIEAAQQRAIADLRSQVSELAIGAAEVVVQKNLDRDTNRALVERYIEQVGTTA
jgi:F-type H+-transporting ATPase subunit b